MKILFLVSQLPYPPDTGAKIRVFNLLKKLSKRHEITLVTFSDEQDDLKTRGVKDLCADIKLVKKDGMPLALGLFLNLFSPLPYSVKKYYSPQIRSLLSNLVDTGKFDLIHCDSLQMSLNVLAQNTIPKALTEHNIESLILKRYAENEKFFLKRFVLYRQFRKMQAYEIGACGKFDYCIAVSKEEKDFINGSCKAKNVSIVANGVDCEYFTPQDLQTKPFSLIFTGSLDWYPNIDGLRYFFKEIYPLINKKIPQANITIVGRNPTPDILEYGQKDDSIKITGRVDDVRPFIARGAVFIVPLRIGGGTRLKILEAMAMAKPVVSTTLGAEGILVKNGENILLADKPQEFAQTIIQLFNDAQLSDNISKAGRILAESQYDWSMVSAELDKIWKGLSVNK